MGIDLICKGCGTAEDVDEDISLCTLCLEWGEEILRDCKHRGSSAKDEDLPAKLRNGGAL